MSKSTTSPRPRVLSKAVTVGFSLTLLAGTIFAGIPAANAYTGANTASTIVSEVAPLFEQKATGSIQKIEVPQEVRDNLSAMGLTYNEEKTLQRSNAHTTNFITAYVDLYFDIDKEKFAASPIGSQFDLDAMPVDKNGNLYPLGFKAAVGDGNTLTGVVQKKEAAPVRTAKGGMVALGYEGFALGQEETQGMIFVAPVVQRFEGGVASIGGSGDTSSDSNTYYIDKFERSDARNEHLVASGQRPFDYDNPNTTVMSEDHETTGAYALIQYYGLLKDSDDGYPRSINLIDPFWISIEADWSVKSVPTAFGKDKAVVSPDGTTKWWEMVKSDPRKDPNRDITNPNAKIVPQSDEAAGRNLDAYAGNIVDLSIRQDSDTGGIQVVNEWKTEFYGTVAKPTIKGPVDTTREEQILNRRELALTGQYEGIADAQELVDAKQAELDSAVTSGASERTIREIQSSLDFYKRDLSSWEASVPGMIQDIEDARLALEEAKTNKPSDTYTFTWERMSIAPSDAPKQWTKDGSVLEVGQQWTSEMGDINAVFTVTENQDNRLVVEMKLNEAMAITEWNGPAQVGTGVASWGSHGFAWANDYWLQQGTTPPPVEVPPVVETPPVVEETPPVEVPPVVETPPVVEAPPVVVEETPPVVEVPPVVEETPPAEETSSSSKMRDELADSANSVDTATTTGLFAGIGVLAASLLFAVRNKLRNRRLAN